MQRDNQHDEARCRIEMLERAASYPGRPRERLLALAEADEICARLYPEQDQAVRAIRVAAQTLPGRPHPPTPACDVEIRLIDLLRDLTEESIAAGEFQLPDAKSTEHVAVGIWTLAFGERAVCATQSTGNLSSGNHAVFTTREALNLLADCLGWHPLSSEWDYSTTRDRIMDHLGTVAIARVFPTALA